MEKGRNIVLDQRTKAESDYAVAAASILAREKFIDWLDTAGKRTGVPLPRASRPPSRRPLRKSRKTADATHSPP